MKIVEVAALLELVEQLEEIGNEDAVLGRVLIPTAQAICVMLGEIQRLTPLESMRSRLCAALGLPADSAPETVVETVEARRVVVPECDPKYALKYHEPTEVAAFREGYDLASEMAESIPDGRVLGEGMVEVAAAELEALRECEDAVLNAAPAKTWARNDTYLTRAARKISTLRANQGGAEHGNE